MTVINEVYHHHKEVKNILNETSKDSQILMTALIGSQNYCLDNENSDIDTFTLILPDFFTFISNNKWTSFEIETSNGKCTIKDFRLMMNLLRKVSPNSAEVFCSKYIYFEPQYENIFKYYLSQVQLNDMIHCNFQNMYNAINGLAKQLHGRNMTSGKKYSHLIRLNQMLDEYNTCSTSDIFTLYGKDLVKAREAKFSDKDFSKEIIELQNSLEQKIKNIKITPMNKSQEASGNKLINQFQTEVTQYYLKLTNKELYGI